MIAVLPLVGIVLLIASVLFLSYVSEEAEMVENADGDILVHDGVGRYEREEWALWRGIIGMVFGIVLIIAGLYF